MFNLLGMKTLAERIKTAMSAKGMKQVELAAATGLTRGAVSLWVSGGTKTLEGENLVRAARALDVSPSWLATGKGSPRPAPKSEIDLQDNPDYPAIRRVKLKLSAGISGYSVEPLNADHAPIVFSRTWYEHNGYSPHDLVAIKVHGASMEPGLYDGDWVVVNTSDRNPKDGFVFAVNYDGEAVIKRLFKSDGRWVAASDNPDKRLYRDWPLTAETFVIGRIVHKQSERI
ncbi:XRE family transcriptional regulator [Burkholderia glumae]